MTKDPIPKETQIIYMDKKQNKLFALNCVILGIALYFVMEYHNKIPEVKVINRIQYVDMDKNCPTNDPFCLYVDKEDPRIRKKILKVVYQYPDSDTEKQLKKYGITYTLVDPNLCSEEDPKCLYVAYREVFTKIL